MEIWIRLQQFSDLHVQKNCSQTSFTNISYSQSASISIFVKTDLTLQVSVGLLAYSIFFCQNKMLACRVDEQFKNSVSCRLTPPLHDTWILIGKLHIQSSTLYHIRAPTAKPPHWRFSRKVLVLPSQEVLVLHCSCFLFILLTAAFI